MRRLLALNSKIRTDKIISPTKRIATRREIDEIMSRSETFIFDTKKATKKQLLKIAHIASIYAPMLREKTYPKLENISDEDLLLHAINELFDENFFPKGIIHFSVENADLFILFITKIIATFKDKYKYVAVPDKWSLTDF